MEPPCPDIPAPVKLVSGLPQELKHAGKITIAAKALHRCPNGSEETEPNGEMASMVDTG
jgi:hypothetical protein